MTDINRARPRRGHKYTKYKRCLGMMMLTYYKQHLKKVVAYKKKRVYPLNTSENHRVILNTLSS